MRLLLNAAGAGMISGDGKKGRLKPVRSDGLCGIRAVYFGRRKLSWQALQEAPTSP